MNNNNLNYKDKVIYFNHVYACGQEKEYVHAALENGELAGDGQFSRQCCTWLQEKTNTNQAFLTANGTTALQLAILLLDLQPGEEVIMPSFTFSSTANAVVLHGGVPVFVDIQRDTMNIDENQIIKAITSKTRAILPVHYAGVSCEMNTLLKIAREYNLVVIEDAAQGILANYNGKALGSIGIMGIYSFHQSKSIQAGECGALLVNDANMIEKVEIMRKTGANYKNSYCLEEDRYTWLEKAYSVMPNELTAAYLAAQLNHAEEITHQRRQQWDYYHQELQSLEEKGDILRPQVPPASTHNGCSYHVLLVTAQRESILQFMRRQGVEATFHYVPLHSAPAGRRYGRCSGELAVTEQWALQLIRLPMWTGISRQQQKQVIAALTDALDSNLDKN